MGKIIKHGIPYGGTSTIAGNISYNNSTSQLNSRTVQNAITELKTITDGATKQVTTLPVASSANVGQIYQYIGTTTSDYTNGYFYKCVLDNGAYVWNNVSTTEITTTTTTVNSITAVGTLPTFTYNSTTENLTYTAGTLPTKGSDTSVINSVT